jgi:hypothetical protein
MSDGAWWAALSLVVAVGVLVLYGEFLGLQAMWRSDWGGDVGHQIVSAVAFLVVVVLVAVADAVAWVGALILIGDC